MKFTAKRKQKINTVLTEPEIQIVASQMDVNTFIGLFDNIILADAKKEADKFKDTYETNYIKPYMNITDELLEKNLSNILYARELLFNFKKIIKTSNSDQKIKDIFFKFYS